MLASNVIQVVCVNVRYVFFVFSVGISVWYLFRRRGVEEYVRRCQGESARPHVMLKYPQHVVRAHVVTNYT